MVKVKIDMTGWIMAEHGVPNSRLTVIMQTEDYVQPNGTHKAQYLCECNFKEHNQLIIRADSIKDGSVKSCGCLHKETASMQGKSNKLYNRYNLTGEYGIGWTSNTNKEFYFDLEDYNKIKDYTWHENNGYAATNINNKCVAMHIVLGYKWHDHKDRNRLNNRKSNLRPCTVQENNQNRSKTDANKSGFIGVCWDNERGKWLSYIKIDQKFIFLGRFNNKKDAIVARLNAEAKYNGEFAPQRHLFTQYKISNTEEVV